MCGIAGIYHLNGKKAEKAEIAAFTDNMIHRGPDGFGYSFHHREQLALGHRRLSILDLSETGKQPMSSADGRYTITYNGEIYNFIELRDVLKNKGYRFLSDTDTEVILYAYDCWGAECLNRFNGMWAFAIWDEREQQLFMARDRFGIKPFYFSFTPGRQLAFASETRAFRFLEGFQRQTDTQLTQLVMEDDYALEGLGYTIFQNIHLLMPGHYCVFRKEHSRFRQERWWSIEDAMEDRVDMPMQEAAEKLRELLDSACRYRLISDVPLATALSGGLDSSSVFACVQKILRENPVRVNANSQKAVSAIFPGLENDEKEYIDLMLQLTGAGVVWVETDYTGLADQIEKDTLLFDAVSSAPLTAISSIYRGMRKAGITVSLDGHGVDEMMFGYRDMVATLYQHYLWSGASDNALRAGETLAAMYHPEHREAGMQKIRRQIAEKEQREKTLRYRLGSLLGRKDPFRSHSVPAELPAIGEPYHFADRPLEQRMPLYETFQHTLPALFRNFDRASMINSIEIRMPFMDYRLVEFLFRIPIQYKFGNGFTKLLLRKAMEDRLPEGIVNRTFKVGINSPAEHWFNGQLKSWILDHTAGTEIRKTMDSELQSGNISKSTVTRAWKEVNLKLIS